MFFGNFDGEFPSLPEDLFRSSSWFGGAPGLVASCYRYEMENNGRTLSWCGSSYGMGNFATHCGHASMMISLAYPIWHWIHLGTGYVFFSDFVGSPRCDRKKIRPRSQEVRRICSAFAKLPKMAKDQYHSSLSPGSEPSSGIGTSSRTKVGYREGFEVKKLGNLDLLVARHSGKRNPQHQMLNRRLHLTTSVFWGIRNFRRCKSLGNQT